MMLVSVVQSRLVCSIISLLLHTQNEHTCMQLTHNSLTPDISPGHASPPIHASLYHSCTASSYPQRASTSKSFHKPIAPYSGPSRSNLENSWPYSHPALPHHVGELSGVMIGGKRKIA